MPAINPITPTGMRRIRRPHAVRIAISRSAVKGDAGAILASMSAIARLHCFALDCPDPRELAEFYSAIVGWPVDGDSDDEWVSLVSHAGAHISFQRVDDYRPPQWPGQDHPQQAHLDFAVDDLDAGEAAVLAVGARKHAVQPDSGWRVYLDPADHPFCLVPSG